MECAKRQCLISSTKLPDGLKFDTKSGTIFDDSPWIAGVDYIENDEDNDNNNPDEDHNDDNDPNNNNMDKTDPNKNIAVILNERNYLIDNQVKVHKNDDDGDDNNNSNDDGKRNNTEDDDDNDDDDKDNFNINNDKDA